MLSWVKLGGALRTQAALTSDDTTVTDEVLQPAAMPKN